MPTLNSKPRSCRFILSSTLHPERFRGQLFVRPAKQKILKKLIGRLPDLFRRPLEVNLPFMQIRDPVGDMKGVLHVVRNNDAGHTKTLLQSADQSIDGI